MLEQEVSAICVATALKVTRRAIYKLIKAASYPSGKALKILITRVELESMFNCNVRLSFGVD